MLPQLALGSLGVSILLHTASHPPAGEPGLFHMVEKFPKEQELKLKCFFRPRFRTYPRSLPLYTMVKPSHKAGQDPKDGDTGSTS